MSAALRIAANAALVVGLAATLAACDTLAPIIAPVLGPPQPACEPQTGLTYEVRLKDRVGTLALAAAPHPGCKIITARAAAKRLEGKVLYLIADCRLLAGAWDPEKTAGAAYLTGEVMPGCAPA